MVLRNQKTDNDLLCIDKLTSSDEDSDIETIDYLYRLCRVDENPNKGLLAKNTNTIEHTPFFHVYGKRDSPYISTCATLECAQMFIGLALDKGHKIGHLVRIDRTKLACLPGVQIVDLNDPKILMREFSKLDSKSRKYARKYKEVFIKGFIPPEYVEVVVYFKASDGFEPEDYAMEDDKQDVEPEETNDKSDKDGYNNSAADVDKDDGDKAVEEEDAYKEKSDAAYLGIVQGPCISADEIAKGSDSDHFSVELFTYSGDSDLDEEAMTKELHRLTGAFQKALESFITKRERTINLLIELITMLNTCRKAGSITKVTCAGVSLAGTIAGLISIPLTGGLSGIALGATGLLSVTAGVTSIGGDWYAASKEKSLMDEAQKILEDDHKDTEQLEALGSELDKFLSSLSCKGVDLESVVVQCLAKSVTNVFIQQIIAGSNSIAKAAAATKGAASFGYAARGFGVLLSVVFVPLDIYNIVEGSTNLQKDLSDKAQRVKDIVNELRKDLEDKRKLLN